MVNRKYKDRLFCLLFGNEEYKDNILSLYNTIEDVIYIKMKNDVSILLDSFLYLCN